MELLEGTSRRQEGTCYVVTKGRWFQVEGTGFPKVARAQQVRSTKLGQVMESLLLPYKEYEFHMN